MADLDEFFAKKDRKKSEGKKFTTVEEIAKNLEESRKRMEKLKQEKILAAQLRNQIAKQQNIIQDDEWRQFEEIKKDYSGLKIQNLILADYTNRDERVLGREGKEKDIEQNQAKEEVPKTRKEPWQVSPNPAKRDEKKEKPTPVKPPLMQNNDFYMPPSLRQVAKVQSQIPAPDVKNEDLFPTLSAATRGKKKTKDDCTSRANNRIEEVKNSRPHKGKYKPPHAGPWK